MKKYLSIFLAVVLSMAICFACSSSAYDGRYRQYDINDENLQLYFELELAGSKYKLSEVKIIVQKKTTTVKSEGKFSIDSEGEITFTQSGGTKFFGTLNGNNLFLNHNGIEYYLKKT